MAVACATGHAQAIEVLSKHPKFNIEQRNALTGENLLICALKAKNIERKTKLKCVEALLKLPHSQALLQNSIENPLIRCANDTSLSRRLIYLIVKGATKEKESKATLFPVPRHSLRTKEDRQAAVDANPIYLCFYRGDFRTLSAICKYLPPNDIRKILFNQCGKTKNTGMGIALSGLSDLVKLNRICEFEKNFKKYLKSGAEHHARKQILRRKNKLVNNNASQPAADNSRRVAPVGVGGATHSNSLVLGSSGLPVVSHPYVCLSTTPRKIFVAFDI